MAKPDYIELGNGERIPILFEDRSIIAIDKPAGWMLAPHSWQSTNRNLPAAIASSIAAGLFWARSRNLKYLRNIHRLDAETSGILLLAKSKGALDTYSGLFESRQMEKMYWRSCRAFPIARSGFPSAPGASSRRNRESDRGPQARQGGRNSFSRLADPWKRGGAGTALIEARPITGRTHQIRVHLAESKHPVIGDELYGSGHGSKGGRAGGKNQAGLARCLLSYIDPFNKRRIRIQAPVQEFLREFQFA